MRQTIAIALLLISFGLAARGIFDQPFLTWDDSNYARLGLPPTVRQHPFQVFSLSYMGAKPAAAVTTSISYLLFGINPWSPVLISLWMGTVLVAVVYQWACRAGGGGFGGWLAVGLLGSSFSLNLYSRWHSSQTAQMLFAAVAGLCLVQWWRVGRKCWLKGAGVAAVIALLFHYLSVYVVLAMGLWLLLAADPCQSGKTSRLGIYRERIGNVLTFSFWFALPLVLAVALSVYRIPVSGDPGAFPLRFYYVDAIYQQIAELGSGNEADPLYYPRALMYYEGIGAVALLVLVEGYFLSRRQQQRSFPRTLLALLLYLPLVILILWSARGSDARPRALATILPVTAVYLGIGAKFLVCDVLGSVRHPVWLAVIVLTGTIVLGLAKGDPLFRLTHPYYAIRDYIVQNNVRELIGWQVRSRGMRLNEWKFMQRDVPILEQVAWVERVEEVTSACEADPDALLFVSGGTAAPEHPGIQLVAHFDNPIDQFIPTLLADGHDLEFTSGSSKFLDIPTLGVRLFQFTQC